MNTKSTKNPHSYMRVACVILNYNDDSNTIKLLNSIRNYSVFNYIIIVDNCSTNGAYERLIKYREDNIYVISSGKNGGYGFGNNFGINYAKNIGAEYVVVANPDVWFEENTIKHCLDIISVTENCVAIAPLMKGGRAFKIAPPYLDITYSSLILNKIFKPRYYSNNHYKVDNNICYVDAVPGSLVIFDIDKFIKCGMYDETIFLYHEEMIIANRFKHYGYNTILVLGETYIHEHSASIRKEVGESIKPFLWARRSHRYYLQHYLKADHLTLLLFDILLPIEVAETICWQRIKYKNKGRE